MTPSAQVLRSAQVLPSVQVPSSLQVLLPVQVLLSVQVLMRLVTRRNVAALTPSWRRNRTRRHRTPRRRSCTSRSWTGTAAIHASVVFLTPYPRHSPMRYCASEGAPLGANPESRDD